MAFIVNDRVKETTTTTGTGTITLLGAVEDFESFTAGIGDGNTTYYCIFHESDSYNEWEVGYGTFTASGTTLTRTAITSSNGDALESFSAGTKSVFCTLPASKGLMKSTDGTVVFGDNTGALSLAGSLTMNAYNIVMDTSQGIVDDSDNEFLMFTKTASAANYINITNKDTGNAPIIAAVGDANLDLNLNSAGTGSVVTSNDLTVGSKFIMPTVTANKILIADGTSYEEEDMSGDATIATGGALTLATVNSDVGSYALATVTVNAKGLVTAVAAGTAGATQGFAIAMAVAL